MVGEDNIDVRIFDRAELLDGDIGADFFSHVLGFDVADFETVANKNESLSVEGQLFLLALNEHLPRFDGDQLSERRGNIARLIGEAESGKGMRPTETAAREFYAQYAGSNEQVRAKWFPERETLFDEDFSKYPASEAEYELSQEDAFRIFADLWAARQKEVVHLKARIERLQKGER